MKTLSLLLFIFCLFFCFSTVNAQILAWDFAGNAGNEATVNSTTTDPNLNVSAISRGAGLSANALADSYSSSSFSSTSTSLNDAIANNDYLQFTVSPQSGFRVSLSSLNATFRRSATGPNTFQWQYSLDGFATPGINVGPTITYTGTETNGVAQPAIDLSAVPALQNVAFPNTVTFRLYGWNASSTAGTFALGRLTGNDLALGGTVEAIPTAALATIEGRVTNSAGRGLSFVSLTLTGGSLLEPKYAMTNNFGYFRFVDVPVGEGYVVTAKSKRYVFRQPSLFVGVNQNLTGIDFIGDLRR